MSRESAIYALANGATVDQIIESMEHNASEDLFSEAEGLRLGLYDWVGCRDTLYCKAYPTRNGERVELLFNEEPEDEDNEFPEDYD